jgi:hypothetical protein
MKSLMRVMIGGLAVVLCVQPVGGGGVADNARGAAWMAYQLRDGSCTDGLRLAPKGDSGVWVSCEDALGVYLSLGYIGKMGRPRVGSWTIGERWWHEDAWGNDVTSFVWDDSGKIIYVATAGTYGKGGIYAVDILRKMHRKMTEAMNFDSTMEYRILRVDKTRDALVATSGLEEGQVDTVIIGFRGVR